MRKRSLVLVIGVLCALAAVQGAAQESQPPLVVFVEGRQFQSAAATDQGPNGITRLADLFRDLGARTRFVRLDEPLPPETRVIVLVRPRRPLAADALARIWLAVENGANLLLALDPSGPAGVNADNQDSGLNRLLTLEYGVSLLNGFLIEPWTTVETINDVASSFGYVVPDRTAHPIIRPLADYDLPLLVWGARHLRVEPFGMDSTASALAYSEPQYAETNTRVFDRSQPAPLEMNIGTDYWGRLLVGAAGENSRTQTRIAVLADGEMLQNGYGLAVTLLTGSPRYPGNRLLAERLAAWLLGLPEDDWPGVPTGFTWIAVDGLADDWDENTASSGDSLDDSTAQSLNIQYVRAFRNDSYLYLQVKTAAPPNPQSQLDLAFDADADGQAEVQLTLNAGGTQARVGETTAAVPDAALRTATIIEARLPLRVTGMGAAISRLCLERQQAAASEQEPDCSDQAVPVASVIELDPAPVRSAPGLLVMTHTTDIVNVRAGPGTDFPVLDSASDGDVFAAIGRNAPGDWILVQNARLTGWMIRRLLVVNGDALMLPVIE